MSRAEGISAPFVVDDGVPKERQLSLPKAILVALLIEAALIAGLAYLSTQSNKPPEKITQVTEFIPMSMPARTPPKPVEPPPPEPPQPEPPKPVEPPPPKPAPIKTEPPKPLPKSPIQEQPKPKPTHHEKPKPHKSKPKKVEPPKEKPTPQPVAEKAPPAPPKPAEPAPPAPAQTGVSSDAKSINRVKPDYPRRALNAGIEGWVKLSFTVTAEGRVTDVTVVDSKPPRLFDRAAVDAVKNWSFKPKMVDGKAVDGKVEQMIEFKLSDQ
jgi:protein TonB